MNPRRTDEEWPAHRAKRKRRKARKRSHKRSQDRKPDTKGGRDR